jgi:hypothetical protein
MVSLSVAEALQASSPRHGKLEDTIPVAMRMTRVPTMIMSMSQKMRQITRVIFMVLGREDERMNDREDNADEESGEVIALQVD